MQVTKITIDGKDFYVVKTECGIISCRGCYFKPKDKKCPENSMRNYLCVAVRNNMTDNLIFTESK